MRCGRLNARAHFNHQRSLFITACIACRTLECTRQFAHIHTAKIGHPTRVIRSSGKLIGRRLDSAKFSAGTVTGARRGFRALRLHSRWRSCPGTQGHIFIHICRSHSGRQHNARPTVGGRTHAWHRHAPGHTHIRHAGKTRLAGTVAEQAAAKQFAVLGNAGCVDTDKGLVTVIGPAKRSDHCGIKCLNLATAIVLHIHIAHTAVITGHFQME